jgi:hypothetical protein
MLAVFVFWKVMNGNQAWPVRPALRGVAVEPDQVPRLLEFRAAHRDVVIGTDEFGNWQGRIPEQNGERVISRYTLCELLDKLDELTEERCRDPGSQGDLNPNEDPPRGPHAGRPRQSPTG